MAWPKASQKQESKTMITKQQSSVQTGEYLVPSPRHGEDVVLDTASGKSLVLDFYPSEAEISRQADDLVFSMENGGSVSISDFFSAGQQPPVLFTLPDGTQLSALDFFASFNPDLDVAVSAPESEPTQTDTRLDDLLEGVSRMGALGTLYWGDAAVVPDEIEEVSFRVESSFGMSSSLTSSPYLQAYDNTGLLKPGAGTTQVNEISPGYYQPGQEQRESVSLPAAGGDGSDNGGWDVTGELSTVTDVEGVAKTGLSVSDSDTDPFANTGFDLAAFIRENTPLQDWEQGGNGLGCLKREVSVGPNASDPKIELAWSMLPGETADPADVTLALLFKVGPDGSLIYVDHQVLEFGGLDAEGRPLGASGNVSWSVEPGENYVTSLVVAGAGPKAGQDAGPGTVLVLDGMEYVYQTEPVWVEPVYEEVYLFTAEAAGNLIADPAEGDSAGGVDHHSEGRDFSVARFFLNGEWHQADGEPVNWEDENGASYRFSLNGRGEYNLDVQSADPAFVPDHNLNIVYEISSADGLKDQASLRLTAQPEPLADSDPLDPFVESVIAGDGLSDIFGDSPTLPDTEILIWPDGGFDDTSFVVTDFSLAGHDRLNFANLLAADESLDQLLDSGKLALSPLSGDEGSLRLDITTEAGQGLQVDVSFQAGELESFSSAYVEKNGTADGMEQALLQIILYGS